MLENYVKKILNAKVYEAAVETSLDPAPNLSNRLKNQVWIKREDLQPVFSFKLRGAYNKMAQLSDEQKAKGVVCASAGNHAQGLAQAAKIMNVKATIVMPKATAEIKVKSVRARGGKVVLHGDSFEEAATYSRQLAEEKGYTYVHPYDDPEVIAGQGTIAREIFHQTQEVDAIFVPVGGGGLIAGIAAYTKYIRPTTKVIGVEFEESACLKAAKEHNRRVTLSQVGIFAEGIAVAQIGAETWKVCKDYVDDVITVTADEICAAIKDIFDDTRSVAETAGAVGVAGLKKYVEENQINSQNLVAICSGANINFDRLRYVAERAEVGEHREAVFAVTIPEHPGSYQQFINVIGKRPVTEFNYRYTDGEVAQIFVGLQTSDLADREHIAALLRKHDYPVLDLTDNDMAKSHVRHMVGGHSSIVEHEVIYRFEFPERPGALMNFLKKLGGKFNISLFHYRNHGAAYGRVLCGMQVAPGDKKAFQSFLAELDYPYWEETGNPAYQLFLANPNSFKPA
ncbi:threonine ammonia-lyase, biosynthetic [Gynuella sp.]|uniref:threonine ammonia-lyase, biosynthetic n=1 Tax=Gynuella sp. TaxID=2969146 RepID=UPI003D0E3404